VDTAKVAIEIQKNEDELVTKEEVEQKVRALMQGEEGQCIKRNVVIMRRNARKAVADGGISKQNFEAYIDHLRTGRPLKNAEFNDGEVRFGITGTTHHMDPVS
jgi:hypothetical protein